MKNIKQILFPNTSDKQKSFTVGNNCDEIRNTSKNGENASIGWFEIIKDNKIIEEIKESVCDIYGEDNSEEPKDDLIKNEALLINTLEETKILKVVLVIRDTIAINEWEEDMTQNYISGEFNGEKFNTLIDFANIIVKFLNNNLREDEDERELVKVKVWYGYEKEIIN